MRLILGRIEDFHGGFAAEDEDTGDSRIQTAFHVGVDAVADDSGFFFGKAVSAHSESWHERAWFADDNRTFAGGIENHFADGAAVRHAAIFSRADKVRIGCDVWQIRAGQQKLAEILECNYRVYGTYERGEREIPVSMVIKLAKLYKTSTDYILSLTDDPTPYK